MSDDAGANAETSKAGRSAEPHFGDLVNVRRRSMLALAGGLGMAGLAARPGMAATATDATGDRLSIEASSFGFSSKASPAANSVALQKAVDAAAIVWLPASRDPVNFQGPIRLRPGTTILGGGTENSKITCIGETAFVMEPQIGWEAEGPRFQDFSLHCANNGLVINDPAKGFTDTGDSQRAITKARFERVRFTGSDKPGSVGIRLVKAFDTVFDQAELRFFDTGVQLVGSDLCEMRGSTRVWQCDTLVDLRRPGPSSNYGSGFTAIGCDFLLARKTFLRSDNHHLNLYGCYFEQGNVPPLTGPALDILSEYMVHIENCRFELPAPLAKSFLRLRGEPLSFVFRNNASRGEAWGAVDWNGDGSRRYWWNNMIAQQIVSSGNIVLPEGNPLSRNTESDAAGGFRTPWIFTPARPGLLPADYGLQCRVRDDAFVIPAKPGFGSQLRFRGPKRPLKGAITIHINARSTRAGQVLRCSTANDTTFLAVQNCVLSLEPRWFTVHRNTSVTDLQIAMLNNDTKTGGDVLLSEIIVEQTIG